MNRIVEKKIPLNIFGLHYFVYMWVVVETGRTYVGYHKLENGEPLSDNYFQSSTDVKFKQEFSDASKTLKYKVFGYYDTEKDAKNLIKLIRGIPSKINLIPFNPWPGSFFKTSTKKNIDMFAKVIMEAGFASPIRKPRGQDIYAACGQLKSDTEKLRKSQINKLVPIHAI